MTDYLDLDTQDDADFVVDDLGPTFPIDDDEEDDSQDEVRSETLKDQFTGSLELKNSEPVDPTDGMPC